MSFRRDVPLVPTLERAVQLTFRPDLRNLEASGELRLEDLLLSASATIYDRLAASEVEPEQIVNAVVYERAVAWQFLGVLAEAGLLGDEDAAALFARSDRHFEEVRPRLTDGDVPRTATEGVPAVLNPSDPPFGGSKGRGM